MKRSERSVLVTSPPGYLDEGLFGRLLLWIFDILPYLKGRGVYPAWRIPSALYGRPGDDLAIPGVVDLAYAPPLEPQVEWSLVTLRNRHASRIGPDWKAASDLWNAYFRIPPRVVELANGTQVTSQTLGVHYRGTDKVVSGWDSNLITPEDMLVIVSSFLRANPKFDSVFLATDDVGAVALFRERLALPLLNEGVGEHHKDDRPETGSPFDRSDRAFADCLMLSRCGALILSSSALSAFAKILTPALPVWRCAASKMIHDGPYFPVAYIPVLESDDPEVRAILERTLADDWTSDARAHRYRGRFHARPNWLWRGRAVRRSVKRLLFGLVGRKVPFDPFYHR